GHRRLDGTDQLVALWAYRAGYRYRRAVHPADVQRRSGDRRSTRHAKCRERGGAGNGAGRSSGPIKKARHNGRAFRISWVRSALVDRRDLNFAAAVLGTTGFGGVGRDRAHLALAFDIEAALVDALVGQDRRDRNGAALAEAQIVGVIAFA